ncbi:group 1 truncated hemoglobin [Pontibacter sp. G13]|uniref:group I truncated hemoglobin n=1 Tax=Pontibacter sp. G13 TaxID=3074898 RepID=UPI00288983B3|nr:group 1 truncated hemoglobin [Pontibacter sp. G13]WNJ16424.1 group 1 truncated hemoglobin [Pontibacter sp. G13]
MESASLFDRLGGMAAVNAAVDIFYQKVLADETVNGFFANIEMGAQSGKLKMFLAYAFGAPMPYSGKNMREAHAHMKLTEAHFGAVAGHLVATLQELEVPQELIDEVVAIALTTKDDVLNVPVQTES